MTAVNEETRLYSVAYVDGRSDENLEESALLLPGRFFCYQCRVLYCLILFNIAAARLRRRNKKKSWSQIIIPPWKDGGAISKENVQDGPRVRKKVSSMKY